MLHVYSTIATARWPYIAATLLGEGCGLQYQLFFDEESYLNSRGPKLNYSPERISDDELWIRPAGLLDECGIRKLTPEISTYRSYKTLFPTEGCDWPFDIFAAAFYLISRYEEYEVDQKDSYGRFPHVAALAFREGFLQEPLVDIWTHDLRKLFRERFPELVLGPRHFRFHPTYDIDIAYAYRFRTWFRTLGALIRDAFRGSFSSLPDRLRVITGRKKDPWDLYEWLDAIHLKYKLKPIYFFLLAAERKGVDRNIDPQHPSMRGLLGYHAQGYRVGLHPSWQSGDRPELLAAEKACMEGVTGTQVDISRQHFLRFTLPETYRRLIRSGILHDYSMGYGTINGFRASISSSFLWYDLKAEEVTPLRIHPFCFMDANAFFEQGFGPAEAYDEIRRLHDTVKKVEGEMITIWHNNILSDEGMFLGWRKVYEIFLSELVYWDL